MIKSGITFMFTILLIAIFTSLQAQNITYSFEVIRPDSMFIKEVSTGAATLTEPRPQQTVSYRLFRSLQEFDDALEAIRKQARDENAKAMEGLQRAKQINDIADKIQAIRPKL